MIASALCITAFAEEATVIRVRGLKKGTDGAKEEFEEIGSYSSFEEGWNVANATAEDGDAMAKGNYERIVVDLLANWTSAEDGKFGSGDGFTYSNAIRFLSDTKITLNLNGFTIKRVLSSWKWNGEVIFVASDADVIINNGTITGGWSGGGAGGIHIDDDAKVILNNVNVDGNVADDDDGGGIAVYDGALLIMNGGSISNNSIRADNDYKSISFGGLALINGLGGGIYVEDSEVVLKNVSITNNQSRTNHHLGAAIYARYSKVTLESCNVSGNGLSKGEDDFAAYSIIDGYEANYIITDTDFINNGEYINEEKITSVIKTSISSITIEGGKFVNNNAYYLFAPSETKINVTNTHFIDNTSNVIYGDLLQNSFFKKCAFYDNFADWHRMYSFNTLNRAITFYDCDMGNSTYENTERIKIVDTELPDGPDTEFVHDGYYDELDPNVENGTANIQLPGSILGEGSFAMIVSLLALIASAVSIFLIVDMKKKLVAVKASDTENDEDEQ